MSLSSSYELLSFQRKVNDALQSVERMLDLERKPRLAADVDHTYGAKYGLVNLTSNAAIIAYMTCFDKLGLDATVLKSIDKTKPVTLRFDSSASLKFLKEVVVDVPMDRSYEREEVITHSDSSEKTTKTSVMKAVHHIKEYHWEVEINWSISIYSGTQVEEKKVIKSRAYKSSLTTQSKDGMGQPTATLTPIELSLTWLLQKIDMTELNSQFKVDTEDSKTKTPRRNGDVQQALDFAERLGHWCQGIEGSFFRGHLQQILEMHDPAVPKLSGFTMDQLLWIKERDTIFNPILPLMEEASSRDGDSSDVEIKSMIMLGSTDNDDDDKHNTLLSSSDISKLLNEHARSLEGAVTRLEDSWPAESSDGVLSWSEATLSLISSVLVGLSTQYNESMSYIESMMENQLIAAIGKRLTPNDLDKFVKFHNAKLLCPMPQPFSYAIRRPEHYPVGLLSIESRDGENECIHSHSREVDATSDLKIPLSAATVIELTGQQYFHGYMNHRFGYSNKSHQLIARARQFSSFILVVGNMTDGSTLDPKDAIIVQNKDELLIPLLLDELPTAKEFKDAVKSLSPEQQRFANAYRKMQLTSSVFGICVVQIKPQLESLLGLPADALDKEMKLTQDLMKLFIDYQVPSDLLSYSGFAENAAPEDKISNVRDNVKGVMDVVNAEKENQLKMEQAKKDMAMQKAFRFADQGAASATFGSAASATFGSFSSGPPPISKPPWSFAAQDMAFGARASIGMSQCELFGVPAPPQQPPAMQSFGLDTMSCSLGNEPEQAIMDQDISDNRKSEAREMKIKHATLGQEKRIETSSGSKVVDFTLIPQLLDAAVEKSGEGSSLRSTTVKTGDVWIRNRQENLLTEPKRQTLNAKEVKKEKNKAFDLLDALSRSGSLPIAYNELHVVVAVTHCFDKDVMSTVVCDNINPIEKLECSTLLLASAVHGVPARELIGDTGNLQRLEASLPVLLGAVV